MRVGDRLPGRGCGLLSWFPEREKPRETGLLPATQLTDQAVAVLNPFEQLPPAIKQARPRLPSLLTTQPTRANHCNARDTSHRQHPIRISSLAFHFESNNDSRRGGPSISDTMAPSKEAPPPPESTVQPSTRVPTPEATLAATTAARPESPGTDDQTTTDDTTTEMPPGGKPRSNQPRREADLSSLLNPAEKVELTALVAKAIDSMLRHVTQLFDPVRQEDKPDPSRINLWSKLPYYLKDLSLHDPSSHPTQPRGGHKENVKPPARSKKAGRATDNRDAAPGVSDPPCHADDVTPRLQELKKEALQHFKKWQTSVQRRIGEISVKRAPDGHSGPPSSGPRGRTASNRRGRPSGRTELKKTPPLFAC